MPIWIIVVDLGLAVLNLLCSLAILWVWFHALGNTAPDDERARRTKLSVALWAIALSLPFFASMIYDLWRLSARQAVTLTAVIIQGALLYLFMLAAQKFVVAWRRNSHIEALVLNGRSDEAVGVLKGWIEAARTPDPDLHHLLGLVHLNADDAELACEQFEEAVRLSPESSTYLAFLAIALSKLNQMDVALELIERAEENDAVNRAVYVFNRCYFLAEAGRIDEARELLPQAEQFYEKSNRLPPLQRRWLTETMSQIHVLCDQSSGDPED